MKEINDKIDEIYAKGMEYHDNDDVGNMTYCLGQITVLRWMINNAVRTRHGSILIHPDSIDSIHAGFKEEE